MVITPAYNEAERLPELLASMTAQTARPGLLVVIDDHSTDRTGEIVDEAAREHAWIRRAVPSFESGRAVGSKVARIVLEAARGLDDDWAFLSKIDADLTLPEDYFERILGRFAADPGLGIAGGGCYERRGGELWLEPVAPDHTRGALKTYRRACWDDIGGIRPVHGWDGIDTILAQMHGWRTRGFDEIRVVHHRPTGSAQGVLRGRFRAGEFAHFMGYHPLFMALRCMRRAATPPYLTGGLAMGAGYSFAALTRKPVFDDAEAVAFLRRKQLRRLLGLGRVESEP